MKHQGGEAVTLRLGPEVIAAAQASPIGFMGYLRARLMRYLRARAVDGPDTPGFFFMVEAAHGIEPHLHGAVIMPKAAAPREAVEKALMEAGGGYAAPSNQVKAKVLYGPAGWVRYISKWKIGTQILLGDSRTVAATNGVRSAARTWYEETRRTGTPVA